MYDHLGGGFARYSVDRQWLVPHFEKMLYDNAQLVRSYLHGYQLTGDPLFERIVRETLAYLEREMLDAEGGFYSAQDADSEGIEGKFFVWTRNEVEALLGGPDAALFNEVFHVTDRGQLRGPAPPGVRPAQRAQPLPHARGGGERGRRRRRGARGAPPRLARGAAGGA